MYIATIVRARLIEQMVQSECRLRYAFETNWSLRWRLVPGRLVPTSAGDSVYNTLFWGGLPSALTSFWTGQFAKEHRTHTVNSILKSAHFLVTLPRAFWHDTRQVTVCLLPRSLVFGEHCLYTRRL
jgi:hypothetical protein